MFNLKRKTEQQIITEIHNEFDTAEDRLLTEADNILAELDLETEESMKIKADRLNKLGFINAAPIKWLRDNSLVKTREDAELIRYYKQYYPFQKFLTETELERICKKYNLVFAPVQNYIKDVPEKNLHEIETCAELKYTDKPNDIVWTEIIYGAISILGLNAFGAARMGLPMRINDFAANHFGDIDKWLKFNYPQVSNRDYICQRGEVHKVNKQGLFICAPQSHFDLKGLKKQGKYSFLNVTITEVKDPIVFRYVRGGVQVLSKWGLEGQDESLVNEKLN